MNKSHLTAITRKGPSLPMRRLDGDGLLVGRVLDYGCGRGDDMVAFDIEGYDPYYWPDSPTGTFNTITCNYVLNVLRYKKERQAVLDIIRSKLTPRGKAYITVRNDRRNLNGRTSRGTWQCVVKLKYPVLYKTAGYVTYILER